MVSSRVFAIGLVVLCLVGGVADARPLAASIGNSPTESTLVTQSAPTVGSCTKITKPGHYTLGRDIHNGKTRISTGCIEIRANDVVFDGNGHLLSGFGVSDTSGVRVENASNVTVRNVTVNDWNRGIFVTNSEDVTVRGVDASNNAIGIDVTDADARLVENTVRRDLKGVVLADPWDDELERNRIENNLVVNVYAPLAVVDVFGIQLTLGPPLDRDQDGKYEDVTGDGHAGFLDAVAFPIVVGADTVGIADVPSEQRTALDFDGDGGLDHGDVLAYAGLTPAA
ncbi:NosD domain-containing protein [Haladaptatus caseinilyticus]|uniref:NosD domain-containing protein n=1 Tax=Haladaptatus caseinilyticus TaxID=2993314 RepID=UPI00224B59B7|nr:NosD domain-containing protein [Haladaptatus caseinilyticus]